MAERDSRGPGAGRSALATRLNNLPATWKLTLAFAVVLSAIAAMGVVLTINLRVVQDASAADNHAHRVAATASSARFALARQEASLRGYIISGDPFYARRIAEVHRPHFQARMADLDRLAAGDPALEAWIDEAQ
ncbi:MAG TPA: CHASE3 domain-containing protein, partial [Phenylobacterium sp.]|nr:CHASE3 domain-containing protein [Phenylobacterium sp.]